MNFFSKKNQKKTIKKVIRRKLLLMHKKKSACLIFLQIFNFKVRHVIVKYTISEKLLKVLKQMLFGVV